MALRDYLEYVGTQISHIRIIDIIDIFLVALVFYAVIKFVRDRRAGKLLIGVGVLFGLLFISSVLKMRALNFILNSVVSIGMIAVVIVFQPELRSAHEKVGGIGDNFRMRLDNDEISAIRSAIGEISVAAEELSKTKTGALIVLERNTKLGDVIRTGTTVDAVTTSFLLGNIFFHNAPMHDGAVIIRKGRVHAAGCFLPLSSNNNIVKELGTRHRAAIGMSENSDALVLVVSEETGAISVAKNGDLKRNITRVQLEDLLVSEFLEENKKNIGRVVTGKIFKKGGEGKNGKE